MTFTLDPETQKITFGVVSDLTNDAISIPLADQFGVSELFRDRFVYSSQVLADVAWVPNDSAKMRANIGTEVLDFNAVLDSTVDSIVHDIGGTINNTAWVLRFSVEFTTLVESLSNVLFIGISDSNQTTGSGSAQDGLWLGLQHTVLFHRVGSMDTDASLPASASFDNFTDYALSTGVKYYVEIKRTASNYTASILTATGTCPVGVTGLRYIKVMNQSTITQTGNFQGTIDDVQFWNGTTVPAITSNHWRIRYKLDITNLDGGTSGAIDKRLYIGLFDEDAISGADNPQDGFFFYLAIDQTNKFFLVKTPNGEQPKLASNDATFSTIPSVTTYYVEMKRDSNTGTVSLYPDDTFTTPTETESTSALSGTLGLRYLKLMNDVTFSGTGAIDGTFDDFEFNDLANVDDMGLVAYWKFEETSGAYLNNSEALASGGSSWDLVVQSLTRGVSSIVPCQNFAVEGTGINSALYATDTSLTLGSFITDKVHDWSINIWMQSDDYGFMWLLNSANSSGSNIGLEMTTSSGFIIPRVRQYNSGSGEVYKFAPTNPNSGFAFLNTIPLDNLWHMISFGYKTSTNQLWSSVDGSAKLYEANIGTAVGSTTSDARVTILNRITFPSITSALDGKLDEYSIWSRELTDAEISTLYNSGSAHGIYGDSCVPTPASSITVLVDAVLVTISATWQFREHYNYTVPLTPDFTFLSEVVSPNRFEIHSGSTAGLGYGHGHIFKVFRKSDLIEGGDIFSFDFSSATGWTTTNSSALNVDTGGGTIDFDTDFGFTEVLYYDLGIGSISDTEWEFRFKLDIDVFTASSPNIQALSILLSDSTSNYLGVSDSFGINIRCDSISSKIQAMYANNGSWNVNVQDFATAPVAGIFYVKIKRTSATTATISLYSDALYTTLIESEVVSIPSTLIGLRYIKLLSLSEVGGSANEINGTIDDMSLIGGRGSDISITIEEFPTTNAGTFFFIADGDYDATSLVDFPTNSADVLKGIGGLGVLPITNPTPETTFTINSEDINYAGSTEDFITVSFGLDDANAGNDTSLFIKDVTISSIGTWEFVSPTVSQYLSGTTQDYGYVNATNILSRPSKTFTIDGIPYAPPAKLFLVNARLVVPLVLNKTFIIDGLPFAPPAKLFLIDARIVLSGDFGLFRDIGDLIIRVLVENPLGLTGDEITDEIREITEVELEWGFLGKKHRVKGWLNYLYKNGTVQNDGSDPDWWQSVWTLV